MEKGKRMLNAILVKKNNDNYIECLAVNIEDSLDTFYDLIECSTIDIVTRFIDNKPYDIIVDDEGLLKDPHNISLFERKFREALVGNLIICPINTNEGEEGELGSFVNLTDAQMVADKIEKHPVYDFNER